MRGECSPESSITPPWPPPAADPTASASGRYLTPAHRADLAAAAAAAVRGRLGRAELSKLEALYRQTLAVHKTLVELDDPAAPLIDVAKLVDQPKDAGS